MAKELKHGAQKLVDIYPIFKNNVNEDLDYPNVHGKALALLYFTCEKHCLLAMYDYLIAKDYEIGGLIHDGLHARKLDRDYNIIPITQEELNNVETHIKRNTGFLIKLSVKEFKVHPRVLNAHIMSNHCDGGDYILDQLKSRYVVDKQRVFFKYENLWTHDEKFIKCKILNFIHTLDIFLVTKGKYITQSKNIPNSLHLLKYVINHPTPSPGFVNTLWTSTIGKLCYINGYYDFVEQEFIEYDIHDPNGPQTTIMIDRQFPRKKFEMLKCMANREDHSPQNEQEEEMSNELERLDNLITCPIFAETSDGERELSNIFYQYLSRAMAGDKFSC